MRITIVGAGDVGAALARHWQADSNLEITVTTTREERRAALAGLADQVRVLRADQADVLAEALAEAEVAVFCLAPTGDRQVGAAAYAATYRASFEVLEQVLPGLPQLRQIVYTGSGSVYGDAGGGWVDETTPPNPGDEHGRVLLEAEQRLEQCRSPERQVCVLRLGAIYGPGRELAPRFQRLAGSQRPGSGQHHCSWIHRDDVVGAIAMAVEQRWDGVVNLVDDHPWTVAELLEQVCRSRGWPPVQWQPDQPPDSRPADRRVSNRRLHALGYRLHHPRLQLPRLRAIDRSLLQAVADDARQSPRLRRNHNFHQEAEPVQRFLNALQPGTYVRPHRHRRAVAGAGFECFLVLQGAIGLVLFDGQGQVLETHRLEAEGPLRGIELADDQFHTLVALSTDAVIFELKQGPYEPTADKDFLAGYPLEGTVAATAQEQRWQQLFA